MGEVRIKWTDPPDIVTDEPVPCTWAGTVVVRRSDRPPLHRWDGTLIANSTTRNEYSVNALVDDTVEIGKQYYYGIFPYDTKGDYRYTKVVVVNNIKEATFEWLYDGSKSSGHQIPTGLDYEVGTINANETLPTFQSDYIDMPYAGYIIFKKKLKKCKAIKVTVMLLPYEDTTPEDNMHILGGTEIQDYVSNPPNINNITGYDVYENSPVNGKISRHCWIDEMRLNEKVTFSVDCSNIDEEMYIFIPVSMHCRIYKIWGESKFNWTCDPEYLKEGVNTVLTAYNTQAEGYREYFKVNKHKCISVCIYPSPGTYVGEFSGPIFISDEPEGTYCHILDPDLYNRKTWPTVVNGHTWYVSTSDLWVVGNNKRNVTNTPEIDGRNYSDFVYYADSNFTPNPPASFFTSLNQFATDVLAMANVEITD